MPAARDLAPFLAHGGRVAAARAAFGGADWIDLSTGVAPWAYPVAAAPDMVQRLPEPQELAALEAAAAEAFGGGAAERVVAVPGSDLALRLLAALVPAARVAVVTPGYAGHRAAWPAARAISADALAADIDADLMVLASPANPDGHAAAPEMLRSISRHTRVILDEAYADPAPGLAGEADDGLVVLRSFGKFYGLPGLRLGFVIAGTALAQRLRAMLGDWPVSTPAIGIATAAYRDEAWRAAQAGRIDDAGSRLDAALSAAGLAVVGRAPLFRYVACGDAHGLFRHLAERAILTRPFADRADRLRIGLPRDATASGRLADALEEILQ